MNHILTTRLNLFPCDIGIIEAIQEGNAHFAHKIGANVPGNWTEYGIEPIIFVKNKLIKHPEEALWWGWMGVHRAEKSLVVNGGFKGAPSGEGIVEIGYEVAPTYRNLGVVTEFVNALIELAFSDKQVKKITAHTLAEENASVRVLKKCGFEFIQSLHDPEDGEIWQWAKNR